MAMSAHSLATLCLLGAAVLSPCPLGAEALPTPEPKVKSSIEHSVTQSGTCVVSFEVKDPESNVVLATWNVGLKAGHESRLSSSEPPRKVEVTLKAASSCAEGTYAVTVSSEEKVVYTKSGVLKAPEK